MPPLYPSADDVRLAMRGYRKASDAHLAALGLLVKASEPDLIVVRYRDVLATGVAVRQALLATIATLGLPDPGEAATLDDLQGLVPDIISIEFQEVGS